MDGLFPAFPDLQIRQEIDELMDHLLSPNIIKIVELHHIDPLQPFCLDMRTLRICYVHERFKAFAMVSIDCSSFLFKLIFYKIGKQVLPMTSRGIFL